MAVLFSIMILTLITVILGQTKNHSFVTEGTIQSSRMNGTLSQNQSGNILTETAGHWETQSALSTSTQGHVKYNQSVKPSLGHTESNQKLDSAVPYTAVLSGDSKSNESTDIFAGPTESYEQPRVHLANKGNNESFVDLSSQTESYQDADPLADYKKTTQTTGLPMGVKVVNPQNHVLENRTEHVKTTSSLVGNQTLLFISTEGVTSTPLKASKLFSWTKIKYGFWNLRINIGLCSYKIYYYMSLTSSYNFTEELWLDPGQTEKTYVECVTTTYVQKGRYINLTIDQLTDTYDGNFTLTLEEQGQKGEVSSPVTIDSIMLKNTSISMISFNPVKYYFESHAPYKPLVVRLHYLMQRGPFMRELPVYKISSAVSRIVSPGITDNQPYPNYYDGEFVLNISHSESVLISFNRFSVHDSDGCIYDYLSITDMTTNVKKKLCGNPRTEIMVYHSPLRFHFHTSNINRRFGFIMMFAVLPRSEEPKQLTGNVFNCSVPHFHSFKPLLQCNTLKECMNGEDEEDCPYRSNECGVDFIDVGTECYRLVRTEKQITWTDAKNDCFRHGQTLATLKTAEKFNRYKHLLSFANNLHFTFIGAHSVSRPGSVSVATLYKYIWQWADGQTAFSIERESYELPPTCAYYDLFNLISFPCNAERNYDYVCEFQKPSGLSDWDTEAGLAGRLLNDPKILIWNMSVVHCPSGHITRDFLSCDSQAECMSPDALMSCAGQGVKIPMFQCQQSRDLVHYTFLCDHVQHCWDNSDEDFCRHAPCIAILGLVKCHSGQCILDHQMCDGKLDCYDGSDETCHERDGSPLSLTFPPGTVRFDGKGGYRVDPLDSNLCPQKHFLCPNHFCLPVYLLCNGIEDCPGREDEAGCDSYTCPGFYRCRGSKVCLHADNVCDGVPQCPEQDDELLCDLSCPDQCHCQGLAFVCSTSLSANSYPALRYLDASGSGMTPGDFSDNMYIINLRLTVCSITSIPINLTLPNLQQFDLSWNELSHLDIRPFRRLNNLRVLVLAGNPLLSIMGSDTSEAKGTMKLWHIDLSQTSLQLLNGNAFVSCPGLRMLNISWSKIRAISSEGFKYISKLEILDSKGSPLKHFPNDLLRGLHFLKFVQTDTYKLCCEAVLPASFNLKNCHTVQNLIASCEDLLRSNIYRTFLWIFALLSIVGNIGSFAARVYLNTDSRVMGSFSTFVTNLSIADLCMGVYLAIVGVADLVYRGEYLWHDDEWKNSTACKIAGFLSLLSSEVSALMICLITLDRFIVLRFPFSRFHFRRTSALITCCAVWLVGLALAAVPLLPITSHWEFYSQSGICIPLPFTSSEGFPGYSYSFSVMILLNLVLFLVIAVGQASVFWSIRTNTMSAGTSKKSQEIRIARRLITVVVSDFLCWFPIGLLGVLSATGTPIPGEVNVAVAIFVLPFNSALNPFLYTFNVVMEKRNKAQEAHLLRRLESRMHTETSFSCRIETANATALQLELNQHVTGDTQNEGRTEK